MHIHSFEPVANKSSTLLILGTMPGKVSLREQQYYGHNRNAFWKIIEAHFNIPHTLGYTARISALKDQGVALWDVLHTCTRESSLDSDIVTASIEPNDFQKFFRKHPAITRVFFNGEKAQSLFEQYVKKNLAIGQEQITYSRLPSTSPANASFSLAQKVRAWALIKASI